MEDKAATFLVTIHAYDESGTRGNVQKTVKGLQDKYLRVTNETILALQAKIATTATGTDENPTNTTCRQTAWVIG